MVDLSNIDKNFVGDVIDTFSKQDFFGSTREEKHLIDCMKMNDLNRKDIKIMQKQLEKNSLISKRHKIADIQGSHNGMAKSFIVERMRKKLADKKT